ncbi:MAG: GIY-YIG nuclease family protein [Chitinophagaceae bacterium]|nr:GIY-YIG nuclease family protein [Chitinophagaceae bacterium]
MIYPNIQQEHYFIYILQCAGGGYYIGLTNDLMKRFAEHEEGKYPNCYTFRLRPITLVYFETIPFLKEAIERETHLKKWSRKKKEALIKQDYHKLQLLAQCQNLSHSKYKDLQ